MRDKLIELIIDGFRNYTKPHEVCSQLDLEAFADYLIAHGVTLATDNNVGDKTPLTNADRIRAMSDEELTTALLALSDCADICQCDNCTWHTSPFCNANIFSENEICGWLKQPAKEET